MHTHMHKHTESTHVHSLAQAHTCTHTYIIIIHIYAHTSICTHTHTHTQFANTHIIIYALHPSLFNVFCISHLGMKTYRYYHVCRHASVDIIIIVLQHH